MRSTLKEKMDALKQELTEMGSQFFREATADLFRANPDLVSFEWKQYTPYFNDGDVCEFGVNSDWIKVEHRDENGDIVLEEEAYVPYDVIKGEREATNQERMYQNIIDVVSAVDEDVMLSLFGDHVAVKVTKDGVTVSEYAHD
jgi:hypothetical protein